jgi:hypothetical protein
MLTERRIVLRWIAATAACCSFGGCGGSGMSREQIDARAAGYDPTLQCSDVGGLWPAERKTREDNEYRDRSDNPLRYCFNCSNFTEPAREGACGGCRTVKGPVHPLGWCTAWTELRG